MDLDLTFCCSYLAVIVYLLSMFSKHMAILSQDNLLLTYVLVVVIIFSVFNVAVARLQLNMCLLRGIWLSSKCWEFHVPKRCAVSSRPILYSTIHAPDAYNPLELEPRSPSQITRRLIWALVQWQLRDKSGSDS